MNQPENNNKTLPDYLAICSRGQIDLLLNFNEVFCRNHGGSHFQFLDFGNEIFSVGDSDSYYLWLEAGEIAASFEGSELKELGPGDVVALGPGQSVSFRGHGKFWAIKSVTSHALPFSGICRLPDLTDTSGGCNNSENAFRRLQIVWEDSKDEDKPDGDNVVGCHVVWIEEKSSRSHYHPIPPTKGGINQHEMYLVLDPKDFGLKGDCGTPGVWTFPENGRWDEALFTPLKPGDVFFIAAPAVHRAVDVLCCVVALPGFKPNNEIYVEAT